jgi:outer membrane protein
MHRYLLLILFLSTPFASRAADAGASAAGAGSADAGSAGTGATAASERGPLRLSMKRAVELAVSPEGNTYIELADENTKQAKSRSAEARSAFLPDIEAQAGETTAMKSLAALGLDLATDQTLLGAENKLTGSLAPLEKTLLNDIIGDIPRVIGPFTSVDVRIRANQDMLDFSTIRRYQASRASLRAVEQDRNSTGDSVTATVAKAYLNALRADADLEASHADVALAEADLKAAENQKAAGSGTGIDVTRAKVQLSNNKQRALASENDRNKAYLQLLRAMGMNLTTELALTDKLSFIQVDPVTVEKAEAEALKNRPDFQAQKERESAARLNAHAVTAERFPSLVGFADYGTTGTNGAIVSLLPTRDYGFALRVPIFDGGRRDARRAEAASQFRQERARTNDLHEQMELDIRTSLDTLHSADAQYKVAVEARDLADSQLTQARRRFASGVASNLEVTDAQTRLARARDNRVNALYNYNLARIDLGTATGTIQSLLQ